MGPAQEVLVVQDRKQYIPPSEAWVKGKGWAVSPVNARAGGEQESPTYVRLVWSVVGRRPRR